MDWPLLSSIEFHFNWIELVRSAWRTGFYWYMYLARKSASSVSKDADRATAVPLSMITFWYNPLASGESINSATLYPPADSPNIVTLFGSPPNLNSALKRVKLTLLFELTYLKVGPSWCYWSHPHPQKKGLQCHSNYIVLNTSWFAFLETCTNTFEDLRNLEGGG